MFLNDVCRCVQICDCDVVILFFKSATQITFPLLPIQFYIAQELSIN